MKKGMKEMAECIIGQRAEVNHKFVVMVDDARKAKTATNFTPFSILEEQEIRKTQKQMVGRLGEVETSLDFNINKLDRQLKQVSPCTPQHTHSTRPLSRGHTRTLLRHDVLHTLLTPLSPFAPDGPTEHLVPAQVPISTR
jgi:hypothetical protein